MLLWLLAAAVFITGIGFGNRAIARHELKNTEMASAGVLYDAMNPICTITPVKKSHGETLFLTAAHCVLNKQDSFFVSFPLTPTLRTPLRLMQVDSDEALFAGRLVFPHPALEVENPYKARVGDKISYAGYAGAVAIQYFQGYISYPHGLMPQLFEPSRLDNDQIQWIGYILGAIGGGPGSSGSAVVDNRTGKVIGTITGILYEDSNIFICPISSKTLRFIKEF